MDQIKAAAKNQAAWHDWQLRAQGRQCQQSDSLWSCLEAATGPFLGAITISPLESSGQKNQMLSEIEHLVAARKKANFVLCDSFGELDLTGLGFKLFGTETFYFRPALPDQRVAISPELKIEEIRTPGELAAFERATYEGFEYDGDIPETGEWHAAASLGKPNMRYFAGRVEGRMVSVSIAVVSDGVVGVYGVATIPAHRKKGYGAALTWIATQVAPGLPSVLEPSDIGLSMYKQLGFRDLNLGQSQRWGSP